MKTIITLFNSRGIFLRNMLIFKLFKYFYNIDLFYGLSRNYLIINMADCHH